MDKTNQKYLHSPWLIFLEVQVRLQKRHCSMLQVWLDFKIIDVVYCDLNFNETVATFLILGDVNTCDTIQNRYFPTTNISVFSKR